MTTKKEDVVRLAIENRFSFRDRMKVLRGHALQNHIEVKVEAELVEGEIVLKSTPIGMQTVMGRPQKNAGPQKS